VQQLLQQQQQQQSQQAEGSASALPAAAAAAGAGSAAAAAAGAPQAAWVAGAGAAAAAGASGVVRSSSSSGPGLLGLLPEHSTDSVASIDGQPLRVVVHSSGSSGGGDAATAVAGGSSGALGSSPRGSGSLSSITTDEDTCGICFDNSNHVAIKYCGHRLCVDCYRKVWELSGGGSTCPFCRAKLEGYMYLDWPLE
jgi:hypothetical protein